MKRIIQQSRLWLAPAVLAAAALLACNDDGTAETQNTPTEAEPGAPAPPETGPPEARAPCDDFLPGSQHVPMC
jgi:hypothetical protein